MIKRISSFIVTGVLVASLASCASEPPAPPAPTAQELKVSKLTQTKASLESVQSKDLIEIRALNKSVAIDRALAAQMQKQSDPIVAYIKKLNDQYAEINDKDTSNAVATNKQIVEQTKQNAEIEQSINSYREDANSKQAQLNNLNAAMSKSSAELVSVEQELKQSVDTKD
jgi:chromosome segregation ATPase